MIRIRIKNLTLINAPDEKCFWVKDGKVLRNLRDLRDALKEMDDKTYQYHANKEKNDFAKWVREVLLDSTLANQLEKVRTRKGALKKVEDRLKKYL